MAYIPPHKRHLKDAEVSSPIPSSFFHPRLQRNSNLRSNLERRNDKHSLQGRYIVYANNSISRWFIVDSTDDDDRLLGSIRLMPMSCDSIDRRRGEKPMVLLSDDDDDRRLGSIRLMPMSCQSIEGRNGEKPMVLLSDPPQQRELNGIIGSSVKSPWVLIADKIQTDLLASFQSVRNEGSEEVKPSLVARFGKVLFHGLDTTSTSSAAETALSQVKRSFYTNIPDSYMKAILGGVVPEIGLDFAEEKEYYHVKVLDKFLPDATISCKCSVMEASGELELHKIELNQVRHLVVDISCLDKDLDLRLMLFTKRTLTALTDDEKNDLTNLVKSAVIDPDVKGGLRWPLGKESSDRYHVVGVWHTKTKSFKSSSMKLKLRHADRFDFRTSIGGVSREVNLKMTDITRELRDQTVEQNPVTGMLQDTLKVIWDHFLRCEVSFT